MKDREPRQQPKQPLNVGMYEVDQKGFKRVTEEGVFRPILIVDGRIVVDNPALSQRRESSRNDRRTYLGYPSHKKQFRL